MRSERKCRSVRLFDFRSVRVVLPVMAALGMIGHGIVSALAAAPCGAMPHPIDNNDIADLTTRVGDLSATLSVTESNPKELKKIGEDFTRNYALRHITLLYKQPGKLRLDGKSPVFGEAVLIMNGTTRFYTVPRLGLHNCEDLKDSPSKRQSLLEYSGLITPETLTFMQSSYVQQDKLDGQDVPVYDLRYRGGTGLSHYRIWVDPRSRITVKRAWYDSENRLKATFYYRDAREIAPGIWLPTRIEVKNADGVLAAVTSLEDAHVDQGLGDDLFAISR